MPATAQVTTGNISGTVTDATGAALPGVTVEAVHTPTGTRYQTVSEASGHFFIPNVRVGGPYKITSSLEGFKPGGAENVTVNLGATTNVDVKMQLATVSESITVTARPDDVINPNKTGSTSTVSTTQIEQLPTVNRTLQDFARTNPYFASDLTDSNGTILNVAGRNNRYNNIQIDGAVNNDLFGLASSGTPGGQTGTQPIALDAIEQLQLVLSPYDVRQSGFTGGGINAVTRSGTNKISGSFFGTKRNKSFIGKGPFNQQVSEFSQTQWGGRLGGAIVKDRLFYFVSGEQNRKDQPNGTSADGSQATNYNGTGTGATPSASVLRDFLKSKYNYDPGSLGDLGFKTNSDLLFGRLDFNANNSNNITLRHNYVKGGSDVAPSSYPGTRTSTRFYFPTSIYNIADQTHSTVAQINSVFGSSTFNEGRIGYQTIKDARVFPVSFPTVEIGGTGERNGAIQVGTERFSGANSLDQKILEVTDDFTWIKGDHTIIIGTHNENFDFKNLFIQDFNGYYYFPTLDAFEANQPTIYRIGFANGSDPKRPTAFKAGQYSLYVNDTWRVGNNLTMTLGLRADKPHFDTTPSFNPVVQTAIGYSTSATPSESTIWEPRIGFNWDPNGSGKQQLRGGIGMFQGRAPYVWISNNYGNTGVETSQLGCLASAKCNVPSFNPDPSQQPRNLGSGAAQSIALSDPGFQFPRIMRTTLGYDRELMFGIRGTVEAVYSKTQKDIFYYNVNKTQTGVSPLDGRPTYASISSAISDAILLSNTNHGDELVETIQLNRNFHNLTLSANYAHQRARSVGEGQSSIAYSNWQFNQLTRGNIFGQEMSTSSFEIKHRFNVAATYNFATGPVTHGVGLYYAAQVEGPYSLLMGGDPNKDGTANNDLLYVPSQSQGLILCPSNATAPTATAPCGAGKAALDPALFYNFLKSVDLNPTSGQILKRNILQQPWTRRVDFHYDLGLPPMFGARLLITADVLNLLNLFDKNSGVEKFVSFGTYTPVTYQGQDAATGKPIYKEAATGRLTPGNQYSTSNLASRWQGRLGLRVTF